VATIDPDRRANDEARFHELYERHYARVFAYALRRTRPEAAQDVVADTFLVAWGKLDAVPEQALPWLLAVARKTLANRARAARRDYALVERLSRELVPGGEPARGLDELHAVARAFARLPEVEQELLRLVAWDGLSLKEAATVTGRSYVACRVRVHRAKRRLAELLEREHAPRPRDRFRIKEEASR
jgi:RNA polymerase sigma-70 factor (ECF subfamily)